MSGQSSAPLHGPPIVKAFHDEPTGSVQYVVADPETRHCAIIDPVHDFDSRSGGDRDAIGGRPPGAHKARRLRLQWIPDTHPHADHFSAAEWRPGARVIIRASVDDDTARQRFPQGWGTLRPYLRLTEMPG